MTDRELHAAAPCRKPWTVRQSRDPAAPGLPPFDTRYQIVWRDADGTVAEAARAGPTEPRFTDAFAALGRSALVQTETGPVAVEDLLPGQRVLTGAGPQTLLWKGSRTILPQHRGLPLHRIASNALGPGRPDFDLMLGPAARIVSRRGALRALIGREAALVPIAAICDGDALVRIQPISAIQVFHLAFARHTTFTANGVELESAHPGAAETEGARALDAHLLAMFPHLAALAEFGPPCLPRLDGATLDKLTRAA